MQSFILLASLVTELASVLTGSVIFYQEGLLKIGGDQVLCLRSKGDQKIFSN